MNRITAALLVAWVVAAWLGAAGCRRSAAGGETVPSPPRELIQRSYQAGQAGAGQAGAGGAGGTVPGPR